MKRKHISHKHEKDFENMPHKSRHGGKSFKVRGRGVAYFLAPFIWNPFSLQTKHVFDNKGRTSTVGKRIAQRGRCDLGFYGDAAFVQNRFVEGVGVFIYVVFFFFFTLLREATQFVKEARIMVSGAVCNSRQISPFSWYMFNAP